MFRRATAFENCKQYVPTRAECRRLRVPFSPYSHHLIRRVLGLASTGTRRRWRTSARQLATPRRTKTSSRRPRGSRSCRKNRRTKRRRCADALLPPPCGLRHAVPLRWLTGAALVAAGFPGTARCSAEAGLALVAMAMMELVLYVSRFAHSCCRYPMRRLLGWSGMRRRGRRTAVLQGTTGCHAARLPCSKVALGRLREWCGLVPSSCQRAGNSHLIYTFIW